MQQRLTVNDVITKKQQALSDYEAGKIEVRELHGLIRSIDAISKEHSKVLKYHETIGNKFEMDFFDSYEGGKIIGRT